MHMQKAEKRLETITNCSNLQATMRYVKFNIKKFRQNMGDNEGGHFGDNKKLLNKN